MSVSTKLSEHFTFREFYDPKAYAAVLQGKPAPQASPSDIDPRILTLLEGLRSRFRESWEDAVLVITPHGGYRPEPLNTLVGGAKNSQHRLGNAADFKVKTNGKYLNAATIAVWTEHWMNELGIKGGLGLYNSAPYSVHVDARGKNVRWFDSYSATGCPGQGGVPCIYKKGTKGAGVVLLQRALNLSADGKFGAETEKALRRWQAAHRLTPDGVFGAQTNKAMGGLLPW